MKLSMIVAALALSGIAASAAQAMPVPAVAAGQTPVVTVDYACGPGWHITPRGRCVPNAPPPRYWGHRPPPGYGWGYHDRYDRPRYQGWYRPAPRW